MPVAIEVHPTLQAWLTNPFLLRQSVQVFQVDKGGRLLLQTCRIQEGFKVWNLTFNQIMRQHPVSLCGGYAISE